MAFEPRTDWKNKPDQSTPIKAEDLIRIEQGIADSEAVGADAAKVAADAAKTATWGQVSNKPSAFTPADHTHEIADVEGLQAALDALSERLDGLEA